MNATELNLELERLLEETVGCEACEREADWVLYTRCCGVSEFVCVLHELAIRAWVTHNGKLPWECNTCHHEYPKRSRFDDMIREVRL